jgi:hypothetical protein
MKPVRTIVDYRCRKTFTWYARICSSPFFSGGLSGGPPLVWLMGIIVKGVSYLGVI